MGVLYIYPVSPADVQYFQRLHMLRSVPMLINTLFSTIPCYSIALDMSLHHMCSAMIRTPFLRLVAAAGCVTLYHRILILLLRVPDVFRVSFIPVHPPLLLSVAVFFCVSLYAAAGYCRDDVTHQITT